MAEVGVPYGQKEDEGLTFHDLRHTAIVRLDPAGIPWALISQITGHRTRRQHDDYARAMKDLSYFEAAGKAVQELVPQLDGGEG